MTSSPPASAWSEPGLVETIVPGVHRVALPLPTDGLRAVNVYVLETDSGLTCIDGGWAVPEARTALESGLASLGYAARDIGSFLVTHVHRDHYTLASVLREELGRATITLGVGERPALEAIRANDGSPFVDRLERCGAHDLAVAWNRQAQTLALDHAEWGIPDTWLEEDGVIDLGARSLRAIATPGHTAGHVVFADVEAGLLFAGDHVLPSITPSIGFAWGADASDDRQPLGDYLSSLRLLRDLPDLRLLPAHGPTDRRTHGRVVELLDHHDCRLRLVERAVEAGAQTAYDVARTLTWTRRELALEEQDDLNAGLAVLETYLHLDLLAWTGVLNKGLLEDVWTFAVTRAEDVG